MSKECRTVLSEDVLAVVKAMKGGGEPRSVFLGRAIRKGLRAMHAEASRNTPSVEDNGTLGLGLAPLKREGEMRYFDVADVARIGALIDRMIDW